MKMYNRVLYLKNKSEWIDYAKEILSQTPEITNEVVRQILTFPFEFDSFQADS